MDSSSSYPLPGEGALSPQERSCRIPSRARVYPGIRLLLPPPPAPWGPGQTTSSQPLSRLACTHLLDAQRCHRRGPPPLTSSVCLGILRTVLLLRDFFFPRLRQDGCLATAELFHRQPFRSSESRLLIQAPARSGLSRDSCPGSERAAPGPKAPRVCLCHCHCHCRGLGSPSNPPFQVLVVGGESHASAKSQMKPNPNIHFSH